MDVRNALQRRLTNLGLRKGDPLAVREVLVPIYNRGAHGGVTQRGDTWKRVASQCMSCRRLRYNLGCAAFRGPIPEAILTGRHDHTRHSFPGDHGLLQDPLAPDEYPELGWSDE